MLQKFLAALLMAGMTVVSAADDVYKWVDSRGQIYYTDLPPTQADAKLLGIFHQESSFLDESGGAEEGDNGEEPSTPPSDTEPAEPPIDNAAMAAVQADVANARTRQCKEAQERYQRYVDSRRLFRQMPDGQRQYLTDQELSEARIKAKQAVDDYCG